MSNKIDKESLLKRAWENSKKYIVGLFIAATPIAASAHTDAPTSKKANNIKTELTVNSFEKYFSAQPTTLTSDTSLAYTGKYYNEICNGSLCWISSQSETKGCGEEGPHKNISSSQIWSSNGLYAGINQMDRTQRKAYLHWMKDKPEYKAIHDILKNNNTKSGWAKAAKTNEHLFLISQENYMSSQYAPEKFKNLQNNLDALDLNIDIRTLHPAIIGEMHKMLVQSPGAYKKIANVTKEFLSTHRAEDLNSEAYATAIAPCVKIGSKALAPHTIEVMNDTSINWKEDQYIAALSKVSPKQPAQKTWFDQHRADQQADFLQEYTMKKLKEESAILPSSLAVSDSVQELAIARSMTIKQKRKKIEDNKKMYQQQAMNTRTKTASNKHTKSLQQKRIENAVQRAIANVKS